MSKVRIIAEIGVNHDGSLSKAKRLVDIAKQVGANTAKFQIFDSKSLVTPGASLAPYQRHGAAHDLDQLSLLKRLELPRHEIEELFEYCEKNEIDFLATAFDIRSVEFVVALGQVEFKVPSGEITNIPYLEAIAKHRYPVLLSTGMSTMQEVERALETLISKGVPKSEVTVLHCTSMYPTPPSAANLRAMPAMSKKFNVRVGYSDHTEGSAIALAAVALGAEVVEKHLTICRKDSGPDHSASMEPIEFEKMVKSIQEISIALGDGKKRPMKGELVNQRLVRKSLTATRSIKLGEAFTADNVQPMRPVGDGLRPEMWHTIIGQRAKKDFAQFEKIKK
jgi:N,N'-diacetyllegionaminate synthase